MSIAASRSAPCPLLAATLLVLPAPPASAQDAASIIGEMLTRQQQRYEEIMSLGGAMFVAKEAQREEMQEALDQLSDMDAQLDGLTQDQQDMIMSRLRPQILQLQRMARGEPLTVVTNVVEVRVNEGPPFDLAEIVFGGR